MSRLWKRAWRITLGALVIEELDVRFKVTRTLRPQPGTCELDVYNMNASHRGDFGGTGVAEALVRVEAGYVDTGPSLLFQGNARRVVSQRDGADWVTKVSGGDGVYAIRTARASRSFGPDSRLEDVINYLADAMGVGRGNISDALRGATLDRVGAVFPQGTVVHGYAATQLTGLLASAGLAWSVQSGVLQVLPHRGTLARTAVLLSPESGLVGSPEIDNHGIVKAKALLIPELTPGRLVSLESATFGGTFRIEKAEYTGDTHGTDWYADLSMREAR